MEKNEKRKKNNKRKKKTIMPIRHSITGKDVKATKIIKPGTYHFRIISVKQELASDKESENTVIDVEGLEGDALGIPIKLWFTEKGVFPQHVSWCRACGAKVDENDGVDPNFDWEAQVGKIIRGKVVTSRGKDGNGMPRNDVPEWYPPAGKWATDGQAPVGSAAEAMSNFS